jgi:hypothetical protein
VEKVFQEKEKVRKKLAHAEAVYALAQKKDSEKAKRPQHKTGFLGLVGKKVSHQTHPLDRSCAECRKQTLAGKRLQAGPR